MGGLWSKDEADRDEAGKSKKRKKGQHGGSFPISENTSDGVTSGMEETKVSLFWLPLIVHFIFSLFLLLLPVQCLSMKMAFCTRVL